MEEHYVIISGTNRKESNTAKIASIYQQELEKKHIRADLLSLENLDLSGRSTGYVEIERKLLLPTAKFIFIVPEYNASFPGVLKTLLDLSDYKNVWWGKKALLTGISSGRSGNVRGMEHLTSILHYLKVVVHPNKLPISGVHKLLDGEAVIRDAPTLRAIDEQLDEFIKF